MNVLTLVLSLVCAAGDPSWPQFQGPLRDNKSADTGLARRWPEGGPPLVWRAEGIGHGYSSVAVDQGRLYTAGDIDEQTVITALDLNGKQLWQAPNGPAWTKNFPGSRGTPTLDGDRLYHMNGHGDVVCLDAQTGKQRWTANMVKSFGGRVCTWGLAESLLVDGPRLFVGTGGEEVAMVALDKGTGRLLWKCRGAGDPPGYASPILVDYAGLRQVITMTGESALGVAAESGKFLWRYEREAPYDVNAATPVYHAGHVAISTTWGRGTTLLKLLVQDQACRVEKVWHTAEMDNEHGGLVLHQGYLYGMADGNHKRRRWSCLDWSSGKMQYQTEQAGGRTGALTFADGLLFLIGERGEVGLAAADPKQFDLAGKFKMPKGGEGPFWARPVVCGGRLYLRHGNLLCAFDVRAR